jgi:LacI family transcriptional regulator
VSAATRSRVREAAKSLGYVPSQAGRALSTRTTGRVGVVSAELGNPFYPALLEPLHDRLAEAGYRTILVTDRGEAPVELEPLVDGSLDGVVLTTCSRTSPLPRELSRRGLPFVLLNRTVDDGSLDGGATDRCVVDNRAGAALAADLLVELGHTRIGAVFGPADTSTGHQRAEGFRSRLASRGVRLDPRLVLQGPFDARTGHAGLRQLIGQAGENDWPTAVFCGNDVIALGVCNAARGLGLAIPGRLSVIGFDDIPMASWEAFDLTTLRADLPGLAAAAAEQLLRRMREPDAAPRTITMTPTLVRRGTHAPIARP